MKRRGILHSPLNDLICSLGHGDLLAVTDRGFPLPDPYGVRVVDLGIAEGLPSFSETIEIILDELVIEKVIFAHETERYNPKMIKELFALLDGSVESERVDHSLMKEVVITGTRRPGLGRIVGFIRTGEFTRYTNVLLQCGVAF